MAQTRTRNNIIQAEAQPGRVAGLLFNKLLYGTNNILGYNTRGTKESINKITLNDLKTYYENNFSPNITKILIAGNVSKEQALAALKPFGTDWKAKKIKMNSYPLPPNPGKSQIYFVDIPGSRQSVIYAGYLALSRNDPDYVKADFVNYRLGGAFTSILNQILREEKGFTYGASSYFQEVKIKAPFVVATSVRSDVTFESVKIIKEEMEKYRNGITENDLQFIKNCMILSNALRFETNGGLDRNALHHPQGICNRQPGLLASSPTASCSRCTRLWSSAAGRPLTPAARLGVATDLPPAPSWAISGSGRRSH